jgi:CheY-like chemotaxis protein
VNFKILIVEDDEASQKVTSLLLRRQGYDDITIARNGEEALAEITRKQYDLIIMDIRMPVMDGYEATRTIRKTAGYEMTPILALTAYAMRGDQEKCLAAGADEYIAKPIDTAEFAVKVNRFLAKKIAAEKSGKENFFILLVEDYKHAQIIIMRELIKMGYTSVVVRENGVDGLKAAQEQQFGLILMDIQMPVMDGFTAIKRIREMDNYKATPIIALPAFAMMGDREKCLESGATDYISKPIDKEELKNKIDYLFSTRPN